MHQQDYSRGHSGNRGTYKTPDRPMQETMTSADLNMRMSNYGGAGASGRNLSDIPSYGQNQMEDHRGSTEYNDITSGLGSADTHIYYVFQNQLELEKNIEKIKIQLSLKTDFNLIDAFRIFNESGTGSACI